MRKNAWTPQKIVDLFNPTLSKNSLRNAELKKKIPESKRVNEGSIAARHWDYADLPLIGEHFGFLKKPSSPKVITVFTAKGGVLKTTLTLNLARLAALHNIKTCVIGLDMQCDITNILSSSNINSDETELLENEDISLDDAMKATKKLNDLHSFREEKVNSLDELIYPTDIETLKFIPETISLINLEKSLNQANKKEFWLKKKIIDPLKEKFDLIIIDCPPSWNTLISNAIVSCDLLISPIECKYTNFSNIELFYDFINSFLVDMEISVKHLCVPTKLAPKKLSREIYASYVTNLKEGLIQHPIRESIATEEAFSQGLSLPEYALKKDISAEMKDCIAEIIRNLG